MKVSDFIVEYLISIGVKDVFGYPGGMVTHLMDSLGKYRDSINTHITFHEQAAAFSACGYAQAGGGVGVAFATSGPGATNLITGIGNAYFDSIPTIFITGQVNTFESKQNLPLRQRGFQETDIISAVKDITKAAFYIGDSEQVHLTLQKAHSIATSGRKGPVLIDIPMNIFRSEIQETIESVQSDVVDTRIDDEKSRLQSCLSYAVSQSKRPCFLIGNGVKIANQKESILNLFEKYRIPVVSSMIASDIASDNENYYGFIGAYGHRSANFIVAKADLIISIGSRLDIRQVGAIPENFAPNAKLIRTDIDANEFTNRINDREEDFLVSVEDTIEIINSVYNGIDESQYSEWLDICNHIHDALEKADILLPNYYIRRLSEIVPSIYNAVADVGQNMVWVAQSYRFAKDQSCYYSGGMGAMGYSLPASIGVYYATGRPVICFAGDGGIQMNIQELQYIANYRLPIKIVVFNNKSLGMIRHFQDMYFESKRVFTISGEGYSSPDFCKVANAYGIKSSAINSVEELEKIDFDDREPELIEIHLDNTTIIIPKLEYGKPNQDQEPLIDRELYEELMKM